MEPLLSVNLLEKIFSPHLSAIVFAVSCLAFCFTARHWSCLVSTLNRHCRYGLKLLLLSDIKISFYPLTIKKKTPRFARLRSSPSWLVGRNVTEVKTATLYRLTPYMLGLSKQLPRGTCKHMLSYKIQTRPIFLLKKRALTSDHSFSAKQFSTSLNILTKQG